jgi:hypothetical protein
MCRTVAVTPRKQNFLRPLTLRRRINLPPIQVKAINHGQYLQLLVRALITLGKGSRLRGRDRDPPL